MKPWVSGNHGYRVPPKIISQARNVRKLSRPVTKRWFIGSRSGPNRQISGRRIVRNTQQFLLPRGALRLIAYHLCCA